MKSEADVSIFIGVVILIGYVLYKLDMFKNVLG
jgi:hypothetical protein